MEAPLYPLAQLPWLRAPWLQWQQLQDRLGHAYLLLSAQGIGIELMVEQMAKQALCQHASSQGACGQCVSCQLFSSGQHPDFFQLQRLEDKTTVGVDQVRQLIEKQNETSHQGGYKVIVVAEVENLKLAAFNALLKTLEEPAQRTLFILTCAQQSRLPATIKSRCQKMTVSTPELAMALSWLAQQRPQFDQALLKRALRLNWGAPLMALTWIDKGGVQEYAEWQEGLKQAQSNKKVLSKVILPWLKWPNPLRVFDYFYFWALMQNRKIVYAASVLEDKAAVLELLQFQQQVLQAKNAWQGNANKELVLENLLALWVQQNDQSKSEMRQKLFHEKLRRGLL
ncbi:DNA polymerase III subunit delta' [Thiosulfatimonas sediminis]|uniref:DNA-directed DNA polymerase n=1 Tax=Thiosulfatimonas sediminis TaxID=2675054 RepID=A0A6F8PW79_9GAMM|nr:DNA polymerase III subunit delta' [Thiosulfatimonas sediminis]BBP46258.1 DNA polymerase III subunit delta' [Thiosulfatimonas sediminis]